MNRENSSFFRRVKTFSEDEIVAACRAGDCEKLLSARGKFEPDKFLGEAASAGQIGVLDYLITEGARDFSQAIEFAVQSGECEVASFLILCSHCYTHVDSNAVQNFVHRGGEIHQSVDSDGLSEFVFLPKFNLPILISLVEEGRGTAGTDGDVDDCLWFLLITRQYNHQMVWQNLGLTYISERWQFETMANSLTDLDLSKNQIGPSLPSCLSKLVNLSHLDCSDNKLTDLPFGRETQHYEYIIFTSPVPRFRIKISLNFLTLVKTFSEDEIVAACRAGDCEKLLSARGKFEPDKFLGEAASAGQIGVLDYLITEGARDFSQAIEFAVQSGECEVASFLILCSHCYTHVDSNAVQNFVHRGGEIHQSVDSDGLSEFVFLPKFNLPILISLVEEGRGTAGTDGDVDDCLWFLLITRQYNHQMVWQNLGLTYISERWQFETMAKTLTDLDLSKNRIGPSLPSCLSKLVNLSHLDCSDNKLTDLPLFIFEMTLHSLNYSCNLVDRIPHCCPQTLRTLNLNSNRISSLPTFFAQTRLQTLQLSDNPITTFPSVLCSITSLQKLELEGCKFSNVPDELSRLEDLQYLTLPKIMRPASATRALPNPSPLLHHLKEKLFDLKPLYEMKLVVVGKAGSGKSTLIRRLGKDITRKRNISTVGTHVTKLKMPIRDNSIRLPGTVSRTVTFHVWDLGGVDKFLGEAASAGQIGVLDYLITEGARDFSQAIEFAVQSGECEVASFLILCSHCTHVDSNAVQNFVHRGGEIHQSVDSDGLSEFVFLPKFNLPILISLVEEGRGTAGTDGDVDDCLWFLLITRQYNHQMVWQNLGLTYISERWQFETMANSLTDLDLSKNQIGPSLPSCLSKLVNLSHLDCSDNKLTDLPLFIFEMTLHSLNYSCNLVDRIPHCCPQTLRTLNLNSNRISSLPTFFAQTRLQTLQLSDNPITTFPSVLCSITSLQKLELEGCKFSNVPDELSRLEDLQYLTLPKIMRPASATRALPNPSPLLHHLKEKLFDLKPLYEMKLVVVGKAGSGKSTLIRRLGKDITRKRNISTVGTHVTKLKMPIRDNSIRLPGTVSRTVTFHVWDLGGVGAHNQCLLTPASLFVIVFSLIEDSVVELREWLGNISIRAPNSSAIIVGTHKDKLPSTQAVEEKLNRVLDLIHCWGFGGNVSETVNVKLISSVSNEPEHFKTVDILSAELVRVAGTIECKVEGNKTVKALGKLIPNSYFELIRKIVIQKSYFDSLHKVPVITQTELWDIVKEDSLLQDIETNNQLAGAVDIMKNLGILVHFNEPSLQFLYFLDPCWLCNMMEIVVKLHEGYPHLASSGGILDQGAIRHVLKGNTVLPDELFPQYLKILNRFEIALKINKEKLLVPSLLPHVLPFAVPGEKRYFERQITFSSLPSGLMYRLLVAAIKHIFSVAHLLQDVPAEESDQTTDKSDRTMSISEVSLQSLLGIAGKMNLELPVGHESSEFTEILKFLKIWSRGLSFCHPSLHLFIIPLEVGYREGFDIVVSNNSMGSAALCHLVDNVSTLLDDWYLARFSRDVDSDNRVQQHVPCPSCHRHTFPYEECVAALGITDHILCPEENNLKIPLSDIVPDIFLSDLDDLYLAGDLLFSESPDSLLGKGTFGCVYLGEHMGVKVAIKTFNSIPGYPEGAYLDLRREVSILKKMSNPCLVKMIAVKLRPRPCMAIEYAPGGDLADKIKPDVVLPRVLLYKMIHQTSCALAYLHRHQVIYRDLKPSNILIFSMDVRVSPNVKLSDYGIAGEGMGAKGFHGTPGYQAPEMLLYFGTEEYTTAVDVYSFAFLIYEVMCRSYPYSGQHRVDISQQVIASQRPHHYRTVPVCRMGLWNLKKEMERCWAQDPELRPTMIDICKRVSHPGFLMHMGYTVLSGLPPTASYYLPSSSELIILSDTVTTINQALEVTILPDTLERYESCLGVVLHRDLLIALVSTNYCRSLLKFHTVPELSLFGIEETQVTAIAASTDFLLVGGQKGSIKKILADDLIEVVLGKTILDTDRDILQILVEERTSETETVVVAHNSLIGSNTTKIFPVVQLIALTDVEIFILTSAFQQISKFQFGIPSPGRMLCVSIQSKVFITQYGQKYVDVFDLVKQKRCSKRLEVAACSALDTTSRTLWVGTQFGSIYIFSSKRPFNLITRIRPCSGEIFTILPFYPTWKLESLSVHTMVFVSGKGKFADFARSNSDLPQNSRGDLGDGIFAFIFEEPSTGVLEEFESLSKENGLL
eukprot:sb/3460521/